MLYELRMHTNIPICYEILASLKLWRNGRKTYEITKTFSYIRKIFVFRSPLGFMLVELLLALGLLALLFGFILSVSIPFYQRYTLYTERDIFVSELKKARAQAMYSTRNTAHGIYLATSSYTIFEGLSYASRTPAYDEVRGLPSLITIQAPFSEIVFSPTAATTTASGTITFATEIKSVGIEVNGEGRIDW